MNLHIVNKFEILEGPWSTDDDDDDSIICDTNASLTYLIIEYAVQMQCTYYLLSSKYTAHLLAYKWAVYLLLNKGADWGTPKDYAH